MLIFISMTTAVSKAYSFINKWNNCQNFVNKVKGKKPLFILVIGSTETALIPGISAAGKNIIEMKNTPALDAEFITAKDNSTKAFPVSPEGIPSPVILSKALVDYLGVEVFIIDVGAFVKPTCNHLDLNMGPASCLTQGEALGKVKINFLLQKGEKLASNIDRHPYYIIGECIPGGTTTALSVLCALGINAFNLINSSVPEGNSFLKNQTVKETLLEHAHLFSEIKQNSLKAVEYFGDPVQAFICGFIKGLQKFNTPLMLAGGSQMLAIYYLSKLILERHPLDTVVATTSWIANDNKANFKKLAELTDTPAVASTVNFALSEISGLQAYEAGHIKEGVGLGGLLTTANLYKDLNKEQIIDIIEKSYKSFENHCNH